MAMFIHSILYIFYSHYHLEFFTYDPSPSLKLRTHLRHQLGGSASQTLHLHGRLLIIIHGARIARKSGLRLSLLQHLAGLIGLALRKEEK